MFQVVYIDVLFAVNLILNYFILLAVSGILHRKDKKLRIFLGATAGAAYSLFIFFPQVSYLYSSLVKLIFSVILVFISYHFSSVREFLKLLLVFYIVNLLFGGIIFGVYLFLSPPGMLIKNGVLYLDISPLVLIISAGCCYLIVTFISRIIARSRKSGEIYIVRVEVGGCFAEFKALLDTGNNLTDTITGAPVIIAEYGSVKSIIPEEMHPVFQSGHVKDSNVIEHSAWAGRFRMIPFGSVGGSGGLLPAFRPDRVIIKTQAEKFETGNVLLGVTKAKLDTNGRYKALVGPFILRGSDISIKKAFAMKQTL